MVVMKRKDSKFKGKVSSKTKFEKKLKRKDNNAKGGSGRDVNGGAKKRRTDDEYRPSWAVDDDPDYQNASDNDVDVDDIMDMVDREDDSDQENPNSDSLEKRYEAKATKMALNVAKNQTPQPEPVEASEEEMDGAQQQSDQEDDDTNTTGQKNDDNVYKDLAGKSYIENLVTVKNKKAQLQEFVALTSDAIMSHPEANIGRIKQLFSLLDTGVNDSEYGIIFFNVQQTVTEALCVIFNDIIPNYKLAERFNFKETEESGSKHQLKKDTMKTYIYEKNVMQYYKLYLQRLQRILSAELDTSSKSNFYKVMLTTAKARRKLAYVACFCLAELLSHHYNFNCRSEVITNLAKVLCNTNRADDFMRDISSKALVRLFKEDTLGEASLEAINIISDFVMKQNFRVSPVVFKTFLGLNLKELANDKANTQQAQAKLLKGQAGPKKDRKMMSRKERKRAKHYSKLEKELLEAEAEESTEKRHSHKSNIHTKLFALYFRFVKRCLDVNSLSSEQELRDFDLWYRPLFPALLHGMAQFSVFLNDVFIYELVENLMKLVQGEKLKGQQQAVCRLTSTERLCCLKTISQILTLSGNLLTIDFQVPYMILFELCTDPIVIYESMKMLLECIEEMILKRFKELSLKRVVSLAQRLILLTMYLSGPEAAAILTVIKRLFQQHQGAAESLFEAGEDTEQWIGLDRLPEFSHNPELMSTREANSLINFHVLVNQHADPHVRYLAYAILTHFSDASGRVNNIVENRAAAKKAKDLNLQPDLCHELIRAHNPVHVYNLLSVANNLHLGSIFHKPAAASTGSKQQQQSKTGKKSK